MKLSVIIPAHCEPYTQRTVDSLIENSVIGGDLEIIVVLDGWACELRQTDSRVKVVELNPQGGMRKAINTGIMMARGEYIFKVDAHCSFAPGFDRALVENTESDWLVIPRRLSLNEETWGPLIVRKPIRDYCYLNYPVLSRHGGLFMGPFNYKRPGRQDHDIDDVMTYQGSGWMAHRKEFMRRVGLMDDRPETYGPFASEMLEVGLKYWLGGGAVKVNKKTWYAHLGKMRRHKVAGMFTWRYKATRYTHKHFDWAARHWLSDEEPGMIHPFSWLIEKFWPVPTWPEERSLWKAAA